MARVMRCAARGGAWAGVVLGLLLLAACAAPAPLSDTFPTIAAPPADLATAEPASGAYTVVQGVYCGVAARPEYGYTVRYPKIWLARGQGPTTWLADNEDALRPVGMVTSGAPPATDDLAAWLAARWRERGLPALALTPVAGTTLGGQPAVRWDVQYTAADGTALAGYTAATVVNGRLYRVEVALPAARYGQLARAAELLAAWLLLTPPPGQVAT
ncbi:MAG TPA: hypothetical protein VKZ60_08640 [Chloroflexota bacterium]|jgi:hypothetical protein|nr:hypothetical protein [Chloroflexota bacterium]